MERQYTIEHELYARDSPLFYFSFLFFDAAVWPEVRYDIGIVAGISKTDYRAHDQSY